MVGLVQPSKYGEHFHELYTNSAERKLHDKSGIKRNNNKDKKAIENVVENNEQTFPAYSLAHIELKPNASKFSVFSAIRSAVLEADAKNIILQDEYTSLKRSKIVSSCCLICTNACLSNNLVECSCHTSEKRNRGADSVHSDGDTETDEASEKEIQIAKVPLIVGAGLRSLFELIADARNIQPNLCTKALKALFDVIQGQQPESFKSEPEDLINPLYDLLLDLATMCTPPGTAQTSHTASYDANWSNIACSSLIGLCIARGDTGKILKAIAALLKSPKQISAQIIKLPLVLFSLQRTVMSAALNKPIRPDFHSHGVPQNSLVDEFSLRSVIHNTSPFTSTQPVMASDGTFIYLLYRSCLLKVGTGFNGSFKGHVYATNTEFGKDSSGWLGFCAGKLYFKRFSKRFSENILLLNADSLATVAPSNVNLPMIREGLNYVIFSDEESINMICTSRDDSLLVRQIYNSTGILAFDLPLKLARKKFRTLGYAAFEDEVLNQNQIQKIQSSYNIFEPKLPTDIEIQGIACGKEFGLVKASNGKVYYYGKSPSLGLKAIGRTPTMKITELIISKVSNIVQVAVGHDGIHALLVNDDGTVYFAGTARRGEDGDSSKNRRAPKAVKPKRLTRIDGHVVIQAACNNGTSAFVTKTGRLIMFGKDTAHCDAHGYVTDFSDQHITKVALGKAHCVVLNSKGQLFTFGLNNKGQCGRSFNSKSKDLNYSIEPTISSQSDSIDGKPNERRLKYDIANLCDFDDHHVAQGQCRVCVVCKECTGYNISCVSSLNVPIEDRVVGEICPCGHGDAGCSKCGLCSACIAVQETEQSDPKQMSEVPRQRSKTIVFRRKDKQPREENNMPSDVDKDPPRVAPLPPQHLVLASNSPVVQIACGLHHTVVLTLTGEVYTFGSNQYGQLGTGDLQSISGPVAVKVQGAISQIAAGSNHTVLLTHKGIVYTFGNYQKGQLGRLPNDFNNKSSLHDDALKHIDPNKEGSTTAALLAQRQKFLWNCNPGAVFGLGPNFGKKATWIGASGDQTFIKIDESLITTHILPKISVVADKKTILLIPTIPLTFHALTINRRDGSCTAHYNNQVNFVQIIQSNRNSELPEINQNIDRNVDQMSRSMHESRNQIFEVQENQMLMGVVDQRKRRRQEPKSPIEKPMPQIAFALDPQFNVLWVFDGGASKSILCYNVLASEIPKNGTNSSNFRAILSPELSLPTNKPDSQVSRSQASLNLLACLDVFTSAQDLIPSCFEDVTPAQQSQAKESLSNDYQILNRFDNFGGGWGYSGHSVEAIRFSCDTDVLICGFGMFGGRGEYSCKLKLFDLGIDGGGYEKDGVLISETKEIPFECPARSKYHIMLPKAVTALSGRWYLVWARIAGPSSDCGSAGQAAVTSEDQIMFAFKNSKKANNGTDINSGQIPSILYRLITQESKQPTPQIEIDPVQKISKSFANTVTKECFESLVSLLKWSWDSFKRNIREQRDKTRPQQVKQSLEYLIYVNKSCLRLLRKYTNEIYPQKPLKASAKKATDASLSNGSKSTKPLANAPKHFLGASELSTPTSRKANMENVQLAECIGNVRALLIEILNDDIFKDICSEDGYRMVLEILEECHTSFVACFDAFYPTSSLKWNCLCDLLLQMDEGNLHSRLLSAIIAGLCSPSIKLRTTFSLLTSGTERQSIVSPSDNFGLPMLSSSENHQYPILVEQMIYRTQQEKTEFTSNTWSFKDVLVRLLNIISSPVKDRIENIYNHSVNVNDFVLCKDINQGLINNCCHLLARVLAEIVYQTSLNDFERAFLPPRSLHSTGNRFSRCDVSRTWNTGNFGPDAIAFTVDRPGIAIAGATMYSGSGSYDYQLELLYDNTVDLQATGHKWETLESVSGSYDQEAVHNEMAEIKFERPVHVKENTRYALRLCSQGARTCSGDSGVPSIRGPCGTTFTFYSCDLSFNGTTPARGQIPCILYYSNPIKADGNSVIYANQITARDTALQVATDITKKCTELLILARNALAASLSPSDNSSNHTQTIDSEHNITPIEEHMDINWANNSRTSALSADPSLTTARDITKRIESFSKGLMETFKFDKRSTNPFDIEIEIGATEIHPKDLIEDSGAFQDLNYRNGHADTKLNGNDRTENDLDADKKSDSDDGGLGSQMTVVQLLEVFNTSSANVFHTLLPLIYAQIGTLACSDPKSSVQILGLIKEILPHVAALNQLYASKEYSALKSKYKKVDFSASDINKKRLDELDKGMDTCTTSNHYCIVESEHPYRSGSITCQRVEFPPCVQWLAVEFDIQCGTAQLEDYLLISIPVKPIAVEPCPVDNDYLDMLDNNMCMQQSSCKNATVTNYTRGQGGANTSPNDSEWAVIKKFNSSGNWVQNVIVLPGNRVEFSLETASLYAQDPHINRFGFKCLVVGYDNPTTMNAKNSCLIRLEHELAYLGGMCSANLMKKDLNLPDDKEVEDLSTIEETLTNHHALLSKGFALSESILTVNQALESYLPIGSQSNERQFLKDFISGAPGSSGARLATWLQPESRLDPNKCELSTIDEALRYGWPTQITVKIKDQYGAAVLVPELKVEIKAIPSGSGTGISNGNIKMRRISCNDAAAFGGIPPPPRLNYETTIKEKMCFKAISFMKPYNNYSFEELRFCSPVQTRITETLFAQDMEDGTFSVHWTPNAVGSYCLTVAIDGIPLEEVYRVEVKEGGIPPPSHKNTLKKSQPPNKLRKFITMNSAGLRIRSHPTLQSEQVGVIKLNGIISFIDEIENDDGTWLRLSTESIRQHCNIGWYPTEAWCLQFNQHLGKTLLYPVTEATTNTTTTTATTNNTTAPAGNTTATTSTPKSGSKLKHRNLLENIGSPLAVPPDTPSKPKSATCSTKTFDFSQSRFTPPKSSMVDNILSSTNPFALSFMSSASERSDDIGSESDNKAFETQVSTSSNDSHNQQEESMATSHSSSPSNIGSAIAGVVGGGASKLQALQKWFKGDTIDGKDSPRKKSECGDIAPISARDLIRAIGVQEPKGNGNGSAASQSSRSSSPMQIPKPFDGGSSRNLSKSAETSDNMEFPDKSGLPSSILVDDPAVSKVTNHFGEPIDFSADDNVGLSSNVLPTPKHVPRRSHKKDLNDLRVNSNLSNMDINIAEQMDLLNITGDDNIFSAKLSTDTDTQSPPLWPPGAGQESFAELKTKAREAVTTCPLKRAMPPSLAESLRAVFAAFLWHEGVVHDAMACASFLKFHPSLPKEGATVITRRESGENKMTLSREQKAQQRHSVEVANAGNYLNIRPSTLEALTKCGNSCLNNRKYRKNMADGNDSSESKVKLHPLPEIVTVLPPALRCLVYLWEQVCRNCIQIVQSNTLERQKSSSPTRDSVSGKEKVEVAEKDDKKSKKKKKDDGYWCELCEIFLPIPVTYHMRTVHPGCGKSAKGKGYNSVGIFCEGWAGNCGEGGKGASSWFLMCDACREKHVSSNKNINNINNSPNAALSPEMNIFGVKTTTLLANSEVYTTMKENAIFLLELSTSNTNLPPATTKRSPQQMPVVAEHQLNNFSELNIKPSTSRGDSTPNFNFNRHSRVGLRITSKLFGQSTPNRKSLSGCISPDFMWLAPETFACLESLGTTIGDDLPYEIFGGNSAENCYERPLSEISFESCDPNNYDAMTSSATAQGSGTLSKFHRSFSMGQGWSNQQSFNIRTVVNNIVDESQQPKVVFRRRNNSANQGEGSLLICYPSENLRKLVPENLFNTSIATLNSSAPNERLNVEPTGEQIAQNKLNNANSFQGNDPKLEAVGCKDYFFGSYDQPTVPEISNVMEMVDANINGLNNRPSISFITQKHDLEKLRYAMKRSLRIATCRIYSLQALNWLIRSVTQSVCLHDLMWWFVASLSPILESGEIAKLEDGEISLEHPVSFTQISGGFCHIITQSLHVFLQSVADLTLYLPAGSPLQRIAIQSFGIKFRQTDHQFLHNSHVFGNISKILSKSDEQNEAMMLSTMAMGESNIHEAIGDHNFVRGSGAKSLNYTDLNGMFEITVSSRQAMAESLTDNSTETFWESDEEDRNKCKIIEVSMSKLNYTCKTILVHIDNSRDIQNKVVNVVFFAGQSLGDTTLIKSVDIDTKACAWASVKIMDDSFTHFRLEFRGPDNTLRVRQIKLLGLPNNLDELTHGAAKANLKLTNATRIQQQICEAETLRVFRLITAQVFGKLIATGESNRKHSTLESSSVNSMLADSLDLREHMVGILFSRSKLSHLQKQVIVHIVHAIKKEAQRAKEEWEIANVANYTVYKDTHTSSVDHKSESSCSERERFRAPDTYCFEMLSMVLALSGSAVGRSYLSHQHGLLRDLLSLLHTGSDRVQRQVTALLRRILPEITPEVFADLLCVQKMPPFDFNIVNQNPEDFDMNRLGILDIFLAVIAKSLQLQVKVKTTSMTSKTQIEKNPSFVRLCNSVDLSVHQLRTIVVKPKSEENEIGLYDVCMSPFGTNSKILNGNVLEYPEVLTLKRKPKDVTKNINQRWFLKSGVISMKQAESIINLIKDMASGKLSDKWSRVTKAAIAESVLNLTRLEEIFRSPENCIKTATLWLALASLCVLDKEHVEKLSSGQWSKVSDSRPMCSNHDDGETAAIIQCETCGSLCGDCDRFLHLNRKTRNHKRTVCKEEEEAIRVELHESCGRTKLFWLLALADSKTLKGMVEFRDGSHTIISGPQEAVGRCRFCGVTGNSGLLEIGNVCSDVQCQEYNANSCLKTKPCGHVCGGVANEKKCLPCLQHVCHSKENELAEQLKKPKLTQDADDMCMICFVEALSCAPSIHLDCGHVFHYHCCKTVLEKRWTGPRITFGFSLCPICKADILHDLLDETLEPINVLKQDVKRKALMRIKYEGIVKASDPKDLTNIAMDRYAYYVCFKCNKAYYGGEARCDAEIGEIFDPEELVCGACSDVARAQMCPKHGTDFLEYKCRYCCSVAVFFCFGTTHFCDTCHDDFQRLTNIPKNKLPQCPAGPKAKQLLGEECPLHVIHPPTGEEFALGCGICRNAQTF